MNGVDVDVLAKSASVAEVKVAGGPPHPAPGARRPPGPPRHAGDATRAAFPAGAGRWRRWPSTELAVDAEDLHGAAPGAPRALRREGLADRADAGPGGGLPALGLLPLGRTGARSRCPGQVRPFASSGELALEAADLDLRPVGPYADAASPLRLVAGTLGVKARATFDAARARSPAGPSPATSGSTTSRFGTRGATRSWSAGARWSCSASTPPRPAGPALRVIRLTEPRLRGVIFEDGTTGLATAAGPAPRRRRSRGRRPAPGPAARRPAPPARRREAPAGPRPGATSVGLLQIRRGRVSLTDRSTRPPVNTALTDLEARIVDLSSDPRSAPPSTSRPGWTAPARSR